MRLDAASRTLATAPEKLHVLGGSLAESMFIDVSNSPMRTGVPVC